jgi:hypothetical protein
MAKVVNRTIKGISRNLQIDNATLPVFIDASQWRIDVQTLHTQLIALRELDDLNQTNKATERIVAIAKRFLEWGQDWDTLPSETKRRHIQAAQSKLEKDVQSEKEQLMQIAMMVVVCAGLFGKPANYFDSIELHNEVAKSVSADTDIAPDGEKATAYFVETQKGDVRYNVKKCAIELRIFILQQLASDLDITTYISDVMELLTSMEQGAQESDTFQLMDGTLGNKTRVSTSMSTLE